MAEESFAGATSGRQQQKKKPKLIAKKRDSHRSSRSTWKTGSRSSKSGATLRVMSKQGDLAKKERPARKAAGASKQPLEAPYS